jgi:hypothetical protein
LRKRGKRERKRKKGERTSKSQKDKIFAKGPNLRSKWCVRGGGRAIILEGKRGDNKGFRLLK